ncbi:MAG TPA: sigma 54-interacting transcriptional regulator [Selenomonadales bacterium]|nr:sigma 54-interacting transcriptional regulator [Selenomonadales bacterium]
MDVAGENRLLWKIIDSSYDGLFMTDGTGQILYCNDAYLRISGLRRSTLLGRHIDELVREGVIPDACSPEVIRTSVPLTKVIDYYHGVSALVTSIPVADEGGRIVRVVSNVRDITELMRIRAQLKDSKDLNEEYRRKLRQVEKNGREDRELLVVSPAMERVVKLAERVSQVSSPVLIQGESGVGKDMLARFIHDNGDERADRPFVQINCSAIPETLLESELFGYEAGAFTGASKKGKVGLFELANNGTLFLDEIGEMPAALQVKLLDVLQRGKVYRLGGTKTVQVRARIIAATNTNLERLLEEGRFRRDLYYRLSVIPIVIPPLRERREDIIPLIAHFMERINRKFNWTKTMTPAAADMLTRYGWPGNVRELRNVVEHMMVVADKETVDESHIPAAVAEEVSLKPAVPVGQLPDSSLKAVMEAVEREVIAKTIVACGSMRRAADRLGIDLSTLVRKKRKHGIK